MEGHVKLHEGMDVYFAIEPQHQDGSEKALKDEFSCLLEFDKTVEIYLVDALTISCEID